MAHALSTLWGKTPSDIVQILADEYGDTSSYGDKGLHIVAILQAKVAEEVGRDTKRLVRATWALVGVTILVALATAAAVVLTVGSS